MPYIASTLRPFFDEDIAKLTNKTGSVGELNYAITRMVDGWIVKRGLTYASVNEAIGVLECAKQELYRRIAAPYEDRKIAENGDVYVAFKEKTDDHK